MQKSHLLRLNFCLIILLFFTAISAKGQSTVSGTVIDEAQNPLPGVNVFVKGTTTGTVTDAEGHYSLSVPENANLIFSFIGYGKKEISVNNRSIIDVELMADDLKLDELVVIGYGTVQKSDLTGSVSQVDAKELENLPASRVDQLLQGKVPGAFVTSVSGAPGAKTTIRIRGGNSIKGDNEPLYVVDGFIVGTGFNLNNINANDIESIEVLKDASAIAIYGTRGANGVILVTTKSGKGAPEGETAVSVNYYSGVQMFNRPIDLINGPDFAAYANEDAEYRKTAIPFPDMDAVANTDWQEEISRDAPMQNLDVSISGNTKDLNYFISANYFNQDGIVKNSGIKKYIFRANFDNKISRKIKYGMRTNLSFLRNQNSTTNFWSAISRIYPAAPVYNEDGSFYDVDPIQGGPFNNPVADIELRDDHSFRSNILSTFYLEYKPIKGLLIRSTIGPKISWTKRNIYASGKLPSRAASGQGGFGQIRNYFSYDILNENTISYSKKFNEQHKINLLGGFTWQTSNFEGNTAQAEGFLNDVAQFNDLDSGDPLTYKVYSDFSKSQLVSWLARTNYSYKSKYLVTLVGRVDGSSRLMNKYKFFPSAAVAWRLDQEPFIKDLGIFDALKLRTSFGVAGSQSVAPYRTLATLKPVSTFFNETEVNGVVLGRPASEDLGWETTSTFDVGLEAGFLQGRLNFELDYYFKKTKDLLLDVDIPSQTGFSKRLQNLGSLQNQGLELMVNSVNVSRSDFKWETTVTLAGNRSKVLELGDVDEIIIYNVEQGGPGAKLIVGQPASVFTGLEYLGTWKTQEEIIEFGNSRDKLGGPRFKDTNGDGQLTNEDYEVIGNPEPTFYGGISNTLSYKNFKLDIYFQGTYGNNLLNEFTQFGYFGVTGYSALNVVKNRWTPENPDSDVPRVGPTSGIRVRSNSKLIEDGSFLRLKNIRLSYKIPVEQKGVKDLNVYLSGSNLWLLSDFIGFDPEATRFGTSSVARGILRAEYPNATTVTAGVQINF